MKLSQGDSLAWQIDLLDTECALLRFDGVVHGRTAGELEAACAVALASGARRLVLDLRGTEVPGSGLCWLSLLLRHLGTPDGRRRVVVCPPGPLVARALAAEGLAHLPLASSLAEARAALR